MKLPKDLKDAIFSVDSAGIIQETGKKYNLMVDKIGELADETGLVMLGLTHPKDFISNLVRRLEIDAATARKIADEINTRVFKKVRDSLKKLHGINDEKPQKKEEPHPSRDEIVKEIEKEHSNGEEPRVPEIIKGRKEPSDGKYPQGDPYREQI